jgi:exopolyphosphatase/guanosine-5'-triphosphate,3'-diphosphate pyrophosphatase
MSQYELRITINDHTLHVEVFEHDTTLGATQLPVGQHTLSNQLEPQTAGDPPRPEELTNAIGLVVDHLDDIDRELPASIACDGAVLTGHGVAELAAVEAGCPVELPVVLSRAALEDIFRTLATEAAHERASNPGLPADWVHPILAVATVAVAVVRGRDLGELTLGTRS